MDRPRTARGASRGGTRTPVSRRPRAPPPTHRPVSPPSPGVVQARHERPDDGPVECGGLLRRATGGVRRTRRPWTASRPRGTGACAAGGEGGTRTPTGRSPSDFKSDASADFATSPVPGCQVAKRERGAPAGGGRRDAIAKGAPTLAQGTRSGAAPVVRVLLVVARDGGEAACRVVVVPPWSTRAHGVGVGRDLGPGQADVLRSALLAELSGGEAGAVRGSPSPRASSVGSCRSLRDRVRCDDPAGERGQAGGLGHRGGGGPKPRGACHAAPPTIPWWA